VFVRRQRSSAAPMLDLALFRIPTFTVSLLINLLAIMFMFGIFIFFAQYLQLVAGLTALEAGLWSLPGAVAFTAMSFFNAKLMEKFSGLTLFVGGLLLSAFGFVGLTFSSALLPMVFWMIIVSAGFTPVIALTTGYIVGAVPPEKAGVASALSETAAELGGALGIALLGSFATFIYRARMVNVEGEAASKTSIAATVDAVKTLPAAEAAPILESARAAFMTSFHATAIMAAIVLAGLAALAQWKLKTANAASH
jgi:MFS transporter, DHA2 family, multidrug resistance protein